MTHAPKVVAAALAAALAFPTLVHAQEVAAVTTVDLNLRAGPGPHYPIVALIPTDAEVTLHGCLANLTWCDVGLDDGKRGWAFAYYLKSPIAGGPPVNPAQAVSLAEMTPPPPVVTFDGQTYWAANYANEPFFADRDRYFGPAAAGAEAVAGILIGRPLGQALGGAAGQAFAPPDAVVAMLRAEPPPQTPILLEGEIVVGAAVPENFTLTPVPDFPQFAFAYINGRWVLIDPANRTILYIELGEEG
jgi:uncharacterized protein YraI